MNKVAHFLAVGALGMLAGCADPNTVLFVTNSSLGINFDSKPPTANIAYDRTEGFIGPRFENGGAPPAVASIETGGNIFEPKVRQVYATGAAATKATQGPTAPDGPKELGGDTAKKQLMFFGTSTTVGLKVGFGTTGTPDSLLFGYRRKEASVIPIAETTVDGKTVGVYPSVLAAIDMNTKATDVTTTGLTTKQFFATGPAAEALATNETVAAVFRAKSIELARGDMTDAQIAAARAEGFAAAKTTKDRLGKVTDYITAADGSLDKDKLKQLVEDARKVQPNAVPENLKNFTSVGAVRDRIAPLKSTVDALFSARRPEQT